MLSLVVLSLVGCGEPSPEPSSDDGNADATSACAACQADWTGCTGSRLDCQVDFQRCLEDAKASPTCRPTRSTCQACETEWTACTDRAMADQESSTCDTAFHACAVSSQACQDDWNECIAAATSESGRIDCDVEGHRCVEDNQLSAECTPSACPACQADLAACTSGADTDDARIDCQVEFHRCVEDNGLSEACSSTPDQSS